MEYIAPAAVGSRSLSWLLRDSSLAVHFHFQGRTRWDARTWYARRRRSTLPAGQLADHITTKEVRLARA